MVHSNRLHFRLSTALRKCLGSRRTVLLVSPVATVVDAITFLVWEVALCLEIYFVSQLHVVFARLLAHFEITLLWWRYESSPEGELGHDHRACHAGLKSHVNYISRRQKLMFDWNDSSKAFEKLAFPIWTIIELERAQLVVSKTQPIEVNENLVSGWRDNDPRTVDVLGLVINSIESGRHNDADISLDHH